MQKNISSIDLGIIEFPEALEYQEKLFNQILQIKKENSDIEEGKKQPTPNYLVFCEHPHVYTLGKSGSENNLLIDENFLKKINATYYKTNRGGDITYHGYGQVVGYPIFDLENFKIGVKEYVYKLEESLIKTLKEFNIFTSRLENATGVWTIGNSKQKPRKICAIGIKVSRYVTMHGFALNVNTDLKYFNYINPCGFTDKGVTSIKEEIGEVVDASYVKSKILKNFVETF